MNAADGNHAPDNGGQNTNPNNADENAPNNDGQRTIVPKKKWQNPKLITASIAHIEKFNEETFARDMQRRGLWQRVTGLAISGNRRILEVELSSVKEAENLLDEPLNSHGRAMTFRPVTSTTVTVSVLGVPLGYPMTDLKDQMAFYGTLGDCYELKRDILGKRVNTGKRIFKFKELNSPIPRNIKVGDRPVRVIYTGQDEQLENERRLRQETTDATVTIEDSNNSAENAAEQQKAAEKEAADKEASDKAAALAAEEEERLRAKREADAKAAAEADLAKANALKQAATIESVSPGSSTGTAADKDKNDEDGNENDDDDEDSDREGEEKMDTKTSDNNRKRTKHDKLSDEDKQLTKQTKTVGSDVVKTSKQQPKIKVTKSTRNEIKKRLKPEVASMDEITSFISMNYSSFEELHSLVEYLFKLTKGEVDVLCCHLLYKMYGCFTNERKRRDNALPTIINLNWQYVAEMSAADRLAEMKKYHVSSFCT